jgi:hypothetical protein
MPRSPFLTTFGFDFWPSEMVKLSVRKSAVQLMSQGVSFSRRRPLSVGIHVIAGAVGVLAGLQHLFSAKERGKFDGDSLPPASAVPVRIAKSLEKKRRDYFSIRRTKSELGYVYWVLQGHGAFQCFVLFDSWREAIDEAVRRVLAFSAKSPSDSHVPVTA